jgi:hypothetical protein
MEPSGLDFTGAAIDGELEDPGGGTGGAVGTADKALSRRRPQLSVQLGLALQALAMPR